MEAKTLALFLGCDCATKYVDWSDWGHPITLTLSIIQRSENDLSFQIKPILRPLSSMTEDEYKEMAVEECDNYESYIRNLGNRYIWISYYPTEIQYLLSKGFDLFGLIEKGEAIDSTTINPKN